MSSDPNSIIKQRGMTELGGGRGRSCQKVIANDKSINSEYLTAPFSRHDSTQSSLVHRDFLK
jgi:hypothetical protein